MCVVVLYQNGIGLGALHTLSKQQLFEKPGLAPVFLGRVVSQRLPRCGRPLVRHLSR